jgi:hypothetical protein
MFAFSLVFTACGSKDKKDIDEPKQTTDAAPVESTTPSDPNAPPATPPTETPKPPKN